MYDITCSIVLYKHTPETLQAPVNSFLNNTKKIKLFLIDNSPTDTLRYAFNDNPDIEYIFTGENLGYGKAHNIAIRKVMGKTRYHLVLNPDVEFDPVILDKLFDFMQLNPKVGLTMPQILYSTGDIQYLCKQLPAPLPLFARRFLPGRSKRLLEKMLRAFELRHKDYNNIIEAPYLSGCFMFIKSEVFEDIGLFDEKFFMYLEDTDLTRRIYEKYRTLYYPEVSVIHGYQGYKSLDLVGHAIYSSFIYFNKWGWLSDKRRKIINRQMVEYDIDEAVRTHPKKGFIYGVELQPSI